METSSLLVAEEQSSQMDEIHNSKLTIDPQEAIFSLMAELRSQQIPFIIATVIEVIGSASARTGSKAVFDQNGRNLLGWVGGGCAERFIGEQSLEVLTEKKPRIVLADLDDEIFGLGVACGGKMRVFLDPIIPAETITLPLSTKFQNEILSLTGHYGWAIKTDPSLPEPKTLQDLLLCLVNAVAGHRGITPFSLRKSKNVPAHFHPTNVIHSNRVTIIGRTRITEALARHFTLLNYSVRAMGPGLNPSDYPVSVSCSCLDEGYGSIDFSEGEVVIVAGHSSHDPWIVEKALKQKASHVAMIGSYKRSLEVLTHLKLLDQNVYSPLFVPAGLDIDARNPDEIALSIIAEVILAEKEQL